MASFTTGDDIENAFSIISANGGSGPYESGFDAIVERWDFPRFPGAEKIGTCSTKGAVHRGIHTEVEGKSACKNFTPDRGNMYLSRSGIGSYDTDVETLVGWMEAPRNRVGAILLLGEPGTGKTALIEAAVTHSDRTLTTVVCTPDHTKNDLLRSFVGEGNGDLVNGKASPFTLGPLAYAAVHGHVLYMDEIMLLVDGVKPLLYSLADGRRFLPEGNVDGSALQIHDDFRLVLSSNPMVRGASLPEPLASRCASTTLTVVTNGQMLRDLAVDESIVATWEALGNAGLWQPQIREVMLADYWMPIDVTQAASALVPEHCPESQRKAVCNTVISFLGGNLRGDGRLVVA